MYDSFTNLLRNRAKRSENCAELFHAIPRFVHIMVYTIVWLASQYDFESITCINTTDLCLV